MLKQRILTALVLAPAAIAAIFYMRLDQFAALLLVVIALGAWEWGPLMGFASGFLLLWLNPKGWTMAVAAAAAYAALSDSPLLLALLLGAVFGLAAALSLSLWCSGGLWLAQFLTTETRWRSVNIGLALLLAASIMAMWR